MDITGETRGDAAVRGTVTGGLLCHLCHGSNLLPLIDFGCHPISKLYLTDRTADQATWPVKLYFCESCGLTQLQESCPADLLYENYVTLSSWKPQPHAAGQIAQIRALPGMRADARIIEIGCNDGGFLEQLRAEGFTNLLGVEPSKDAHERSVAKGFDVIPQFLTPALAREIRAERGGCDLLVTRQNLEHMADLAGVVDCVRTLLNPGGFLLAELPNFDCNLRSRDYSLWEEHVNYFTVETLHHLLALAGVEPLHTETIVFSGEGLVVMGCLSGRATCSLDYVPALRARNVEYAKEWPGFRTSLADYLSALRSSGKKVAAYGAGSRACCLINFAGLGPFIEAVIDDQPEKQHHFLPGCRLPIVPSEELYSRGIDLCLLTVNAENEGRVIARHASWARDGGQFWSVFPPSDRLLPVWSDSGRARC